MNKLAIAYFGTPDFSARLLEKIITDVTLPLEVELVITQPDKRVGKRQVLTPSPVKVVAEKYGIPVQFGVRGSWFVDRMSEDTQMRATWDVRRYVGRVPTGASRWVSNDIDLALLYAYGEIIPRDLLDQPRLGFWNIHPSLLPRYRGAAPMAYPLMLGDTETGVTLIQMDELLDHGPIIAQKKIAIGLDEKRTDLEIKLTDLGYELFKRVILTPSTRGKDLGDSRNALLDSSGPMAHQNDKEATYTRLLRKDDGFIPFTTVKKLVKNEPIIPEEFPKPILDYFERNKNVSFRNWKLEIRNSPKLFYNLFRGLYPWPGLWTLLPSPTQNKRLKLTQLSYNNARINFEKVQLEGKKEVEFLKFNSAYKVFL